MSFDFIEYIGKVWREEFKRSRGTDYYVEGKDRKAIGLLLAKVKKKHPKKDSEGICDLLRDYFKDALEIQDSWFFSNMSLSLINSKINEISQHVIELRKTRKKHKFNDNVATNLKNMQKLYGSEIEGIYKTWQPKTDKKYKRPYMERIDFLRQYGSARVNEYSEYAKNMQKPI